PLPAALRPRGAAAHPAFFDLVRHAADRGLAPSLPRRGRGLRPPSHPRHPLPRRRALRGGLARLSAELEPAAQRRELPARDSPRPRPAVGLITSPAGGGAARPRTQLAAPGRKMSTEGTASGESRRRKK